jgi:hypothetical protein
VGRLRASVVDQLVRRVFRDTNSEHVLTRARARLITPSLRTRLARRTRRRDGGSTGWRATSRFDRPVPATRVEPARSRLGVWRSSLTAARTQVGKPEPRVATSSEAPVPTALPRSASRPPPPRTRAPRRVRDTGPRGPDWGAAALYEGGSGQETAGEHSDARRRVPRRWLSTHPLTSDFRLTWTVAGGPFYSVWLRGTGRSGRSGRA